MTNSSDKQRYLYLESFRGLAAMLVAAFHFQEVIVKTQVGGLSPFGGFFQFGHAGVVFFFVLSGYIIFTIHGEQIGSNSGVKVYFLKRFIRIYPLFLLVMVPVTLKNIHEGAFSWEFFLKSIFLVPQTQLPMLIQSWTLVHELFFYIVFGLSIMSRRFGLAVLLAYLVLGSALISGLLKNAALGHWVRPWVAMVLSENNLLFVLGMAVAWLTSGTRTWPSKSLLCTGFIVFTTAALLDSYDLILRALNKVVYGLGSALLIWGAVAQERWRAAGWARVQRFLGAISYPLYLVHGIAFSIMLSMSRIFQIEIAGEVLLLLGFLWTVMAAYFVHVIIEKPITALLRAKLLS